MEGYSPEGQSDKERMAQLEARLAEIDAEKGGPAWWKRLFQSESAQGRVFMGAVALIIVGIAVQYGETVRASLPDYFSFSLYCLLVTVTASACDYLYVSISNLRFYDKHSASNEMVKIHGRVGTDKEQPGDNKATGLQHMGASVRKGLIFVGAIILHTHVSVSNVSQVPTP